jgi:hypothetical protein
MKVAIYERSDTECLGFVEIHNGQEASGNKGIYQRSSSEIREDLSSLLKPCMATDLEAIDLYVSVQPHWI